MFARPAYAVNRRGDAIVRVADRATVFEIGETALRTLVYRDFVVVRTATATTSRSLPDGAVLARGPSDADVFGRTVLAVEHGRVVVARVESEIVAVFRHLLEDGETFASRPALLSEKKFWVWTRRDDRDPGHVVVASLDASHAPTRLALRVRAHADAPNCMRVRRPRKTVPRGALWNDDVRCVRVSARFIVVLRDWYVDDVDRPRHCLFVYDHGALVPHTQIDVANVDHFRLRGTEIQIDDGDGSALRRGTNASTTRGTTTYDLDQKTKKAMDALRDAGAPPDLLERVYARIADDVGS
jgi:hypothetical protein